MLRQQLQLSPAEPVVAYVGTLGLRSHPVNLLLDAFAKVLPRSPEARLLLVGGGEDYDTLRQQALTLGIADRTIFCGRVSSQDIPGYLSLATVTVDPVYDDLIAAARSPLKIMESLAVGTPVVTGDVGDRRTLLADGALGELVNPGDTGDLADGILRLLHDAERRTAIRAAACEHREGWYWDQLVTRFVQVYAL
jgi:glycosyltransferase involved in cell wall biosynthesis